MTGTSISAKKASPWKGGGLFGGAYISGPGRDVLASHKKMGPRDILSALLKKIKIAW
jgi:hypothetical protein